LEEKTIGHVVFVAPGRWLNISITDYAANPDRDSFGRNEGIIETESAQASSVGDMAL
jgi:hypothetical protein